jgi:hypothetical protein
MLRVPEGAEPISVSAPARVSLFFGVDTCDGQPVSGLSSNAFEVQENGRPLSVLESQRSIRPKGQRYRMFSVLLLDISGSILRSGEYPALREAATRYVRSVLGSHDDGQRLAILTFDGRAEPDVLVGFTGDATGALAALATLDQSECTTNAQCTGFSDRKTCAGWRCVDDSTNLNGAVVSALERLEASLVMETHISWKEAALVVFTDGSDQAARVDTLQMLQRAERSPVKRFTVGLGAEIDEKSLRSLGRDGAWPVSKASGLTEAFEAVASTVTARANRFYLLEYCSPKRSGQHTVKVVARATNARNETLVGGLSHVFDATGFSSGCALSE